jgi:hypothetical protein
MTDRTTSLSAGAMASVRGLLEAALCLLLRDYSPPRRVQASGGSPAPLPDQARLPDTIAASQSDDDRRSRHFSISPGAVREQGHP